MNSPFFFFFCCFSLSLVGEPVFNRDSGSLLFLEVGVVGCLVAVFEPFHPFSFLIFLRCGNRNRWTFGLFPNFLEAVFH